MSIVLVLCLTNNLFAGAETDRDGNWWRGQSRVAKLLYVIGAMDGIASGSFISSLSNGPASVPGYNMRVNKILGDAQAGQLSEGLDVFYQDFRNRNIAAASALMLVAAQTGGMADEDVAIWTLAFRRSFRAAEEKR